MVRVEFAEEKQEIRGFGAGWDEADALEFAQLSPQAAARAVELLTTVGAGLQLIRVRVRPGAAPARPGGERSVLRSFADLGMGFIASVVGPPEAFVTKAKSIRLNALAKYARFLADEILRLEDALKVRFDVVSPQAQPDKPCKWPARAFDGFLPRFKEELLARGSAAKVGAPECSSPSRSADVLEKLESPPDIILTHGYGADSASYARLCSHGVDVWQTEVGKVLGGDVQTISDGLRWGREIAQALDAGVSAWLYNTILPPPVEEGAKGLLTRMGNTFSAPKRFWCVGQFSRFLAPGWRLCRAAGVPPGFRAVCGKSPHEDAFAAVVVGTNERTKIALELSPFAAEAARLWRTTPDEGAELDEDLRLSGATVEFELPANSVVSISGSLVRA